MPEGSVSKQKADLKVIILGAANVGKTTFIHRYIDGKFQETISTIGASFFLKQHKSYNVAIWDTAGEERFTGLSSFYCRNAGAAILAYDMTNEDSFHALRSRFIPLLSSAEPNCLVVVVGMKQDLVTTATLTQDALLLARELNQSRKLNRMPKFETSSVTGGGVDQVFDLILNTCLPDTAKVKGEGTIKVGRSKKGESGGGCGC